MWVLSVTGQVWILELQATWLLSCTMPWQSRGLNTKNSVMGFLGSFIVQLD